MKQGKLLTNVSDYEFVKTLSNKELAKTITSSDLNRQKSQLILHNYDIFNTHNVLDNIITLKYHPASSNNSLGIESIEIEKKGF